MKRLLFLIAWLLLIAAPTYAGPVNTMMMDRPPGSRVITKTFTGFTCNLSTVNGTAFITNPSINLTRFVGRKLTLTAGGKTLVGWGKAAGSGETYTQTAPDPSFNNLNGVPNQWTDLSDGIAISGGKYVASAGSVSLGTFALSLNYDTAIVGQLYKSTLDIESISGSFRIRYSTSDYGPSYTTIGTKTEYRNLTDISYGLQGIYRSAPTETGVFDNQNRYLVNTPSATGLTIVSAQGGATRNWTSNDGIDPNAASFTLTVTAQ